MQCILVLNWPCFQALTVGRLPATTGESFSGDTVGRAMTINHMALWTQIDAEKKRIKSESSNNKHHRATQCKCERTKNAHRASTLFRLFLHCSAHAKPFNHSFCRPGAKPPIQIDQRQLTHIQLIKWSRRVHFSFKSHNYKSLPLQNNKVRF